VCHRVADHLPIQFTWVTSLDQRYAYDVVNSRPDFVASRVAQVLEESGAIALPVPASQRTDPEALASLFPTRQPPILRDSDGSERTAF